MQADKKFIDPLFEGNILKYCSLLKKFLRLNTRKLLRDLREKKNPLGAYAT